MSVRKPDLSDSSTACCRQPLARPSAFVAKHPNHENQEMPQVLRILVPALCFLLIAGCSSDDKPLGKVVDRGKAVVDAGEATASFKQACDAGEAQGCANLGVSYLEGFGIQKDPERGAQLLQSACTQGIVRACVNLGRAYVYGTGVTRDPEKAFALFRGACEDGDTGGCFNLGVAYQQGEGVEQDLAKAAALFQRVCDTGDGPACYNLGFAYRNGAGVEQDLSTAATFFEKACEAGADRGCPYRGLVAGGPLMDEFRRDVVAMNKRAASAAGVSLFTDAFSTGEGKVRVTTTETWNRLPETARTQYANTLFLRWQAVASGLEPLSLQIADPSGNIVMARPAT